MSDQNPLKRHRPTLPANLREFRQLELEKLALEKDGPDDKYEEFLRFWGEHDFFAFMLWAFSTRDWRHHAEEDPFEEGEGRRYLWHPFILDACRRIQFHERNVMRIWSREHLKTTLGTVGRNVHRLIEDLPQSRELTIGIISETKGLAKNFLTPIKLEMEENKFLSRLWPEVFWEDPQNQSPAWTMADAPHPKLQVRRSSTTTKEATFEAIGLEKLPTGPHYFVRNYDDIVTPSSVTNPEQMLKAHENYKRSGSLGREGGFRVFYGTFYHPSDAYNRIRENEADSVEVEIIPCWTTDAKTGKKISVFYSQAYLEEKRAELQEEEFGLQWELNIYSGGKRPTFDDSWLKYYDAGGVRVEDFHQHCTKVMLVDASKGLDAGDFSVISFWDVGKDGRKRLVDLVRDRLGPVERIQAILDMWERWADRRFIECRIEEYGMDETIAWLEAEQNRQAKVFPIVRVGGLSPGKPGFKQRRIEDRLVPAFRNGEILLPQQLIKECKYRGGAPTDLIECFKREEYSVYPLVQHDDLLDNFSRLFEPEMPLVLPGSYADRAQMKEEDRWQKALDASLRKQSAGDWIAPSVN